MSDPSPAEPQVGNEQRMPSLQSYLSQIRSLVLSKSVQKSATRSPNGKTGTKSILVMGNPSADLDSFISAVTASYFYNLKSNSSYTEGRTYIPLLNLPSVKASELWRLRPEFGVAIRLAMGESAEAINQGEPGSQGKTPVLEELITIADIENDPASPFHNLFVNSANTRQQSKDKPEEKQPLFLVDHNSPSIPGLSEDYVSSHFTVKSCIDHHVDEDCVSQDAKPRIITTGIGSCTSLVVQHLREQGMWPSASSSKTNPEEFQALQELSKLALAPVLIDTSNLKATGDKCSDTDREVVKFLESVLSTPASSELATTSAWDRDAFHSAISSAKSQSLNLLSMQEVFDRDYKPWTENTSTTSKPVNIGISSLVRPTAWLVKHAGGTAKFIEAVEKFATSKDRDLGIFTLLTRTGDGRKEVLILPIDPSLKDTIAAFESRSRKELKLQEWNENAALKEALDEKFHGGQKCWFMGDTSKSRKQVGPLLRESVQSL